MRISDWSSDVCSSDLNTHRFDPLFRWTWREEFRLVRKVDLYIMVWACIMFMALELDRANISQALTDELLPDLGMTTNGKVTQPRSRFSKLTESRLQLGQHRVQAQLPLR